MVGHLALLLGLALYTIHRPQVDEPAQFEVTIPVMVSAPLEDAAADEFELEAPSDSGSDTLEVADPVASAGQFEVSDIGIPAGDVFQGGGAVGEIGGGGGALGKGVSFMGVQGQGNRICIIADRSGSMAGGKINFLKQEVEKTLGRLHGGSRFRLFFFSSRADSFPITDWGSAARNKGEASEFVRSISAGGSTAPLPAFRQALAMKPRPDVIFFMTDGLFHKHVPGAVDDLNSRGRRVTIHTISFLDRSSEHLMMRIARDSGGKYRHVDRF
ncbi:MAG: VWA domain-containing protein [Pirellulaceae bacterium]|nr:VWA domain-containing protein [Pirellulaceae bacterium]